MGDVFKLHLELGNDAMSDRYDVADALDEVASKIRFAGISTGDGDTVSDLNGNTVGKWEVVHAEA